MEGEYRTRDYEHNSASGMGDVALMLGWEIPPDDDGFWYRDDHGPVHDTDLRPLLVEELAALATLRDRAKATLRKIVCVEEPDDGVVLLSNDSPTHLKQRANVLTVIFRDDGPLVHVGDAPSYRSVQIRLTDEQCKLLSCRHSYTNNGHECFEEISRCFLECRNGSDPAKEGG